MEFPAFFKSRLFPLEEAMKQTIKSGWNIGSGFATSEPVVVYQRLWDHIQKNDLHDITMRQGLFMGPHKVCLGDALSASGWFEGAQGGLTKTLNTITKKLDGLGKLVGHYREMRERNIVFNSGFISAPTSVMVPENFITKLLYPEFAGRNSTRMGVTDMQSVHFPCAVEGIAYEPDDGAKINTFMIIMTPPNEQGEMSHGAANGVNQEVLDRALRDKDINILLVVNPNYPFTRGYKDAANTVKIEAFKGLADVGKLFVVEDNTPVPTLPPGSFASPAPDELKIAENIVNHIELNKQLTFGRAIQVGIGSTGVQAIKRLQHSSWTGRGYSEMLEPYTLELFELGKIKGTHFVERDGTRTQLDGKMACTFTICEQGSDFYQKLDNNPAVLIAAASRVVIPEAFYGGMGVNNCLAIDFQGHVNSGGRGHNHHSGVGGAAMIMRGLNKGGIAYLCLKSTYKDMQGKLRSSIVPFLEPGTPISLIGPDFNGCRDGARIYLATEHGVVKVSDKSQAEFIRALVSVSDPQFKRELKAAAFKEFRAAV